SRPFPSTTLSRSRFPFRRGPRQPGPGRRNAAPPRGDHGTTPGAARAMTTIGNVGKLDVMTMVAQLVAAERAQPEARIARSEREVSAQISAIGTLRSAFSALGKALEGLD